MLIVSLTVVDFFAFVFCFGFYCSLSKRKIKLNCVPINVREYKLFLCGYFCSFSPSSQFIPFSGEIIRMAAIHLELSPIIDRCCVYLRSAHSFPLSSVVNDETN